MNRLSPIFRFLAIASMILAVVSMGLPGSEAYRAEAGFAKGETLLEAYCVCTHGSESPAMTEAMLNAATECGSGCACLPARSGWQSTLSNRIKEESRGKEILARTGMENPGAFTKATILLPRIIAPTAEPPEQDAALTSLRTIVLLT